MLHSRPIERHNDKRIPLFFVTSRVLNPAANCRSRKRPLGRFAALILSNCIRINLLSSIRVQSRFCDQNRKCLSLNRERRGRAQNEVEALALDASTWCATGFGKPALHERSSLPDSRPCPSPALRSPPMARAFAVRPRHLGAHLRQRPGRSFARLPAHGAHNVFLHLTPSWHRSPSMDIACDMVVESVIDQLGSSRHAHGPRQPASRAGAHGRRGRPHDCRARLRCPARSTRRRRTDDEPPASALASTWTTIALACRRHCRRRRSVGQDGRGNRRRGPHERSRRQGRHQAITVDIPR